MERVNLCRIMQRRAQEMDIPAYKMQKLCRQLIEDIKQHLSEGDAVSFHGLGTLRLKTKAKFVGYNPGAGRREEFGGYKYAVFTLSKKAKKVLNDGDDS